jgi:SAM-dependent methyltransferase
MELVRDQKYFDDAFLKNPNHWEYDKVPFRIRKHLYNWNLIKHLNFRRVCEIGCAAGVFTHYLKRISGRIDAFDISDVVIDANSKTRVDPKIKWAQLDYSLFYPNLDYSLYDLITVMEVFNYFPKKRVEEILKHLGQEANKYHFTVLLSLRLNNGGSGYGTNEYSYSEISPILESHFRISAAAAISLREEPSPPCAPELQPFCAKLQYLYCRERLRECTESLGMGVCSEDVEVASWLLEEKDVSSCS